MSQLTVQQTALKKAIAFLNAAGASYSIMFEEETYSNRKEKLKGPPRTKLKDVYAPWLDRLETESVIKVQCPEGYDLAQVRGAMCGSLATRFGNGNTITSIDRAANSIEILRV